MTSFDSLPPGALSPAPAGSSLENRDRIRDAAEQFEALLLAQLLRAARESGGGTGADGSSGSCTGALSDVAEQQLAAVLSRQGGLGLGRLITEQLTSAPAASPSAGKLRAI